MIVLVRYDRAAARLVSAERFADAAAAADARLQLELEMAESGEWHEVVVLEAACDEDLQKTHGRYGIAS